MFKKICTGLAISLLAMALLAGTAPAWAEPSPRAGAPAEAPSAPQAYELAILIDLSGSFQQYLGPTRGQLQRTVRALRPGDTVILAVFSNESCNTLWKGTIQGPADQAALESVIGGFQISQAGGTEPVQALNRTISEMVRVQNDKAAQRMFLFFSDGFPDAPEGGLRGVAGVDWNRIPSDMELFLLSYANTRDTELVRELSQRNLRYSVLSPQGTEEFVARLVAGLKARPAVPSVPVAVRPLAVPLAQWPSLPAIAAVTLALLALVGLATLARRKGFVGGARLHLAGARGPARQVPEQMRLFLEDGTGERRRLAGPFQLVPGLRLRVANEGAEINLPGEDLVRSEFLVTRSGVQLRPGIGSTHPVRLNGKRLREATEVRNGARVQFSPRYTLRVEIGRPAIEEAAG
jgi:hypothetical protein